MIEKPQGLRRRTGVVLRREISPEGDIRLMCLFRGDGVHWLSLPGGGRGRVRLGGSTEPLTWGVFSFYKGRNRSFLKEIEVKKDFWGLRNMQESLKFALGWCRLLSEVLPYQHPVDEVIPIFFWALELLEDRRDPWGMDLRFLWRVLKVWGVAPSLSSCGSCGKRLSEGTWKDGVFLCPVCSTGGRGRIFLEAAAFWAGTDKKNLPQETLSEDNRKNLYAVRSIISSNLKAFR